MSPDPRLGVGGNNPPTYAEEMMGASAAHRVRAEALVKSIGEQTVASLEDSARVTALANLARTHKHAMDTQRVVLKKPHDDASADVQRAFAPWIRDLDLAIERARGQIDQWREQQEALAGAAQREANRMAEEERKRAQQLDTAAQELRAQGNIGGGIKAELDAMQAAERAERLAEAPAVAERLDARQIRTQLGGSTQSTRRTPIITDAIKFCRWMLRNRRESFMGLLTTEASALVRGKLTPDGVEVREVPTTRFFR